MEDPNLGRLPATPQEAQALLEEGYHKCLNPRCNYYVRFQEVHPDPQGNFTCPHCTMTYSLLDQNPFGNLDPRNEGLFGGGRKTTVGLTRNHVGDIAEAAILAQGQIPGYGPIESASPGKYHDPIDMMTQDFAVEIKGIATASTNWRFVPGEPRRKSKMIERAQELGKDAILGLLVMLNFETSEADVYGVEMPLTPWINLRGRTSVGPIAFRHKDAPRLLEKITFENPFLDPDNPQPHVNPEIPW